MKVALYARVSTTDKDQTTETQFYQLRRWAEAYGHDATEFADEASATDFTRRTAWIDLQERLEAGEFEAVVVLRLDRAFRNTIDTLQYTKKWDDMGIRFISITENIETETPHGRMFLTIMAALGQMEKERTSERVKEGMERARAEGKQIGRRKNSEKFGEFRATYMEVIKDVKQAADICDVPITTARRWAKEIDNE